MKHGTRKQSFRHYQLGDKQAILKQLASIRQLLKPVLQLSLTTYERKNMIKMGDKSLAFVGKALEYADKNPSLIPPYLNVAEAAKDYALAADLKELSRELGMLSQAIDENLMVASSEAYDAALIFHASVKGASRANTPGSSAIYEDLVQRFPRGGARVSSRRLPKTSYCLLFGSRGSLMGSRGLFLPSHRLAFGIPWLAFLLNWLAMNKPRLAFLL